MVLTMEYLQVSLALSGGVLVLIVISRVLWPLIIGYEITPQCLRVVLFRCLPVKRIAFSNIEDIQIMSFWKAIFGRGVKSMFCQGWCNRYLWGDAVVIRQRRGLIRDVVVTPKDPQTFVESMRKQTHDATPCHAGC